MHLDQVFGVPAHEHVLTASWTPQHKMVATSSDLPDTWIRALRRVSNDLPAHQFGGTIERIDFLGEYDTHSGYVPLLSSVTATGQTPTGFGASGALARVDSDEETVTAALAELVADQIARAGIAWPYRNSCFMTAQLIDGVARWSGTGNHRIGSLASPP